MKNLNFKKEYNVCVSYKLAKKLYQIGFQVGTPQCITQYTRDYIYDGDPQHPESHKKGEIDMFGFWHKNNLVEKDVFECPTVDVLITWLLFYHNIYVMAVPEMDANNNVVWYYETRRLENNRISSTRNGFYQSRIEAIESGLEAAVDAILVQMNTTI